MPPPPSTEALFIPKTPPLPTASLCELSRQPGSSFYTPTAPKARMAKCVKKAIAAPPPPSPSSPPLESDWRSPYIVPLSLENYAKPFRGRLTHGRDPEPRPSAVRLALKNTRMMARWLYHDSELPLQPDTNTKNKTHCAAVAFFAAAYRRVLEFPLINYNKCLGFAVVPGTQLVLVALSQGKEPSEDNSIRKELMKVIEEVNAVTQQWIFELVQVSTKAEYIILRSQYRRTDYTALEEWVAPRSRCVEVALMMALCKAGSFNQFTPEEIAPIAYGGGLWETPDGDIHIWNTQGSPRNRKYMTGKPIPVPIDEQKLGWLDVWKPCEEHCDLFGSSMQAFGAAGWTGSGSDLGPRGEWSFPDTRRLTMNIPPTTQSNAESFVSQSPSID